jgi:aminomethyltransferase
MGKKTPLYAQHVQANAKIVDFGGWNMPLHYGSQLNEHHQVRRDVGMFDVSHMTIIDLSGKRVREFLRYLLANDVGKLKESGKALYSCMLNEQGGVIDDLIVYFQDETSFRMIVNAATREKDLKWIMRHAKNFAVQVTEREDLAMLAIQGPQAREKVHPFISTALQKPAMALKPFYACWNGQQFIARTGYTGEDGFEVILPTKNVVKLWTDLQQAGVAPIGLGARDTLRLEAGMNLSGTDMDENYTPLESGLEWTVAWSPANREFIGRGALEIQKENREHKVMVGLVLQTKGVLRNKQTIYNEREQEGLITSGSFSPTLGVAIALARIPQGYCQRVYVAIRNKRLLASVVKPPFVKHGKACVDIHPPVQDDIDD